MTKKVRKTHSKKVVRVKKRRERSVAHKHKKKARVVRRYTRHAPPITPRVHHNKSPHRKPHHVTHKATPVTINMPPMPAMAPQQHEPAVNKILVENFVSLQKVLTNLSTRIDDLTDKISKLLEIFEISAKALAEKDFDIGEDKKELVNRLDNLLDQNRTLARGMALMHERIPREQFSQPMFFPPMPQQSYSLEPQGMSRPLTREITPEQTMGTMGNPIPPPPSPPGNPFGFTGNQNQPAFESPMDEENV